MLKELYISNLALIKKMHVIFGPGMNVITGETGAGKSIMMNGLSLVLGKRADMSLSRNKDEKLVVEATFDIKKLNLQPVFDAFDVDYDDETVIRREILPSGKSRAFVNDMPVRLDFLQTLGPALVDIHSQHQTLLLKKTSFKYDLLDTYSGILEKRQEYKNKLIAYKKNQAVLEEMMHELENLKRTAEFRTYQLQELRMLDWDMDWEEAEQKLKMWDKREQTIEKLSEILFLAEDEQIGVTGNLRKILIALSELSAFDSRFDSFRESMENISTQFNETMFDLNRLKEEYLLWNPEEKSRLEEQLDRLFTLMNKHRVQTPEELLAVKEQLEKETTDLEDMESRIVELQNQLSEEKAELEKLADELFKTRKKHIPLLTGKLEEILSALEMKNTRLKWEIEKTEEFNEFGKDTLKLLMSADKGKHFGEVEKTASGGELSRLMLAFKSLLAQNKNRPVMVLDEIDAGISGEVAKKTADLVKSMAENMQVIVITHLPQMAVKGDRHFKVFKREDEEGVISDIKELSQEERIREIAEMIEGKPPSESAVKHAEFLLTRQN